MKAILIADKDLDEGALLRNSLEACGYDVSTWIDVQDARDRLTTREFDLVIMSTNLGDSMNALIADLRPKKIPPKVVLVADEDEGDAAARCFLPVVVVVNRPFRVGEVADMVEQLLGPAG